MDIRDFRLTEVPAPQRIAPYAVALTADVVSNASDEDELASGRFVLASTARHFRGRFSAERRKNLEAAEQLLVGSRRKATVGLGLFALSPVPSAQLFIAAGLLTVPLLPLTAVFFAGRLVSYSLYVAGASAAKGSLGDVLTDAIGSPIGIALQVVFLAGLVLLLRVDWAARLANS